MKKITLSSVAVALCAVSLSACQSSKSGASGAGTVTSTSEVGSVGTTASTGSTSAQSSAPPAPATSAKAPPVTAKTSATAKPSATASPAPHDDDSYAFAHRCTATQVTLQVSPMTDVPTRRLIAVRNTGATSCGLSYYPLVGLGSAQSADHSKDVKPLIPGGLGGPPAYVLYAGKTAYAVLDLNPGGSGSGPATTLDEINVLVSDSMPNAATQNFPLGGGSVGKPKLGLYERGVADAVASMQGANTPQ
ncbi:hypothetical protein Caci_2053 [Catenulispora acidiphila DSM 44928]|uniref:DUF4232 domain-containing protein n=1 Tax=Catenulispora acidiphila (strain DSM 44928 / JCM 14897 / NBRC 102108 / NRRL B-24433 / ID139908) TaxID=479433 RepID=C7QFZ6_CATAD|nr:DUF4232 domain-containing protein [Catenulispora acidiphila]ACU70973.1 hypothetical protein Caci_2053 [Catenulispora acidiphila DSM 44928]